MKALLVMSLVALSLPVQADVFKCINPQTKRTLYQPKPCASAVVEQRVEVKRLSATEEAAAVERLRNWQAKQVEEEALKEKIAEEEQEAQLRAAEVEAAQRNAAARQELARAQNRLANEINKQPVAIPDQFPVQPVINSARAGASATQIDRRGEQGPVAVPVQPVIRPVRVGASATQASRWGTQASR